MALFSTWTERADMGARMAVVYALMLLLLIVNVVALSYPFSGPVRAPFLLMAIYYWSIYRPTLLPVWLVFAGGFLVDLISGLPPGLSALVFVLTRMVVTDQRRFLMGQPFFMIWVGFFILCVMAGLVEWLIFGVVNGGWPPLWPFWFSVFLGMAIFPPVCVTLHLTHKILPAPHTLFSYKSQR